MTQRLFPNSPAPLNTIDLNCDMGESNDDAQVAIDRELLKFVTSINVACGGHAGDVASMERTVWAARAHQVAVGAHPSYPDREDFGRLPMHMPLNELEDSVRTQIADLAQVCEQTGARMRHVKPHGALYHAAMTHEDIADAIARAASHVDNTLIFVGLAGSTGLARWKSLGCRVAAEAFADRRYENNGSLRSRQHADSLITRPHEAVAQALWIAVRKSVIAIDGTEIPLEADTICLHSDTPGAVEHAQAIRESLEGAGIRVAALR